MAPTATSGGRELDRVMAGRQNIRQELSCRVKESDRRGQEDNKRLVVVVVVMVMVMIVVLWSHMTLCHT